MSKIIYHSHHIIPRHAGGTNHPDNITQLTIEEHAEAHRLLYKKYNRWQDKLAYEGLSGYKGKEEIIKEKMYLNGKSTGERKHSSEALKKMSEGGKKNRGRKHTEEEKKKISEYAKNRVYTEETKKKMSKSTKNQKRNSKGQFTK